MKHMLPLLLSALLLSGCGSAAQTAPQPPAPTPPAASAPAPAPEPEPPAPVLTHLDHSGEGFRMQLDLPDGWDYEHLTHGENGLCLFPAADPALRLYLRSYPDPIGICGTGVTFTERSFAGGTHGTVCTEQIGEDLWYLLIYKTDEGHYGLEYSGAFALWQEYEPEIEQLLETVKL